MLQRYKNLGPDSKVCVSGHFLKSNTVLYTLYSRNYLYFSITIFILFESFTRLELERGDHIVPSFEELFPGLRGDKDVDGTGRKMHIGEDYYQVLYKQLIIK